MKRYVTKKKDSEAGMLTVETVLCLLPFFLIICAFISFTNIYLAHNKIEFAMYQAANNISAVAYPIYTATGLQKGDKGLNSRIDTNTQNIDDLIDNLGDISDGVKGVGSSLGSMNLQGIKSSGTQAINGFKGAAGNVKNVIDDPKSLIRDAFYRVVEFGEEGVKSVLTQAVVSNGLVDAYIEDKGYLSSLGVSSAIDYSGSTSFSDAGKFIDIHASYDLTLPYLGRFSEDHPIRITQELKIPAWLDGDGGEVKAERGKVY